jgi:hypothetical protein
MRGAVLRDHKQSKSEEIPAEVALRGLGRYTVVNRIRWQEADGKVSGNPEAALRAPPTLDGLGTSLNAKG